MRAELALADEARRLAESPALSIGALSLRPGRCALYHQTVIDDPEIDLLRQAIDQIDGELLQLLERRARVVLEVGERKRQQALKIYDPDREQALLDQLVKKSGAPLDRQAVESIFRQIVSDCRRLEQDHVSGD